MGGEFLFLFMTGGESGGGTGLATTKEMFLLERLDCCMAAEMGIESESSSTSIAVWPAS